jgi:hypothetical protein
LPNTWRKVPEVFPGKSRYFSRDRRAQDEAEDLLFDEASFIALFIERENDLFYCTLTVTIVTVVIPALATSVPVTVNT